MASKNRQIGLGYTGFNMSQTTVFFQSRVCKNHIKGAWNNKNIIQTVYRSDQLFTAPPTLAYTHQVVSMNLHMVSCWPLTTKIGKDVIFMGFAVFYFPQSLSKLHWCYGIIIWYVLMHYWLNWNKHHNCVNCFYDGKHVLLQCSLCT